MVKAQKKIKENKAAKLKIQIEPSGRTVEVPMHTRIKRFMRIANISMPYTVMAAMLDGRLVELNYRLSKDCRVRFLDYSHPDAMRMYRRGLCFVLIKAAKKVFPKNDLVIRYSISDGLYCSFPEGCPVVSAKDLERLKMEMKSLIDSKIQFVRKEVTVEEAIKQFTDRKMMDKVRFFRFYNKKRTRLYYLGNAVNYFYGYLPPDTGYLEKFKLTIMSPGFVLRYPTAFSPNSVPPFKHQVKLSDVFREYETWAKILEIQDVGSINRIISDKNASELVQIAEAMHEKKIAYIADKITHNFNRLRVILVAGPSSSGKTTFTKRLALHLKANGLKLVQISLDNYFLDREFTPRDKEGGFNFEVIEALDLNLFNKHLRSLISGKKIEMPRYDFSKGRKAPSGRKIKIDSNQLLLIEGIHGLNDKLTYSVPQDQKFKIYTSPITHLNFDNNNLVSSTDLRLIRRIVRDNFFRNYTADKTMDMWPKVRKGERDNIFVFTDDADIVFNSSLVYEMAALKRYIEPQLESIKVESPYYIEARRLLNVTSCFLSLNCINEVPPTSILREFIGNSAFKY